MKWDEHEDEIILIVGVTSITASLIGGTWVIWDIEGSSQSGRSLPGADKESVKLHLKEKMKEYLTKLLKELE